MKTLPVLYATALALLTTLSGAKAAAPTLSIGDPAPALKTGEWVQGEAVTEFARDKVYIVEFWATWCGPCRTSIPHLNEIHEKFKDKGLVVIGQNVWEEREDQVKPFVEKMGPKMTYRVALDDKKSAPKGAMAATWMEAAGQNGIPAAFLVGKDGKIAWIGHPMGLQVETVESVLAGSYDVAKAAEEYKKQKSSEGRMQELGKKYNAAMQAKDWVEAETTLNEIAKYLPNGQEGVMGARIQIQVGKGDLDAAATLAQQMADKSPHPGQLNSIAWLLLTQDNIKGKALDIAYALAVKANTAAEGKDPAILDTVARAAFLKGDKAKAIELEQKAVDLAADGDQKPQFQSALDSYKEGKLPKAE